MEECLASAHRQMVQYMIEHNMEKKAEEVTLALIDSPKAHPDNFIHLAQIDQKLPYHQRPKRLYNHTIDSALDR